jgi:pimeloyl-ACP methyl ester carboxylesterase
VKIRVRPADAHASGSRTAGLSATGCPGDHGEHGGTETEVSEPRSLRNPRGGFLASRRFATRGRRRVLPLVIVAGWRSPLASFGPLAAALDSDAVGIAVPGLEFLEPPSEGAMTVDELASDVAAAVDVLEIGNYAVVGHGHGANVALALAARDARVRAAALIDGGYYTYAELYSPEAWTASAQRFTAREFPSRAAFEQEFERVVFRPARGRWTIAWAAARDAFARESSAGRIRLHFDLGADERQLADGYAFDALAYAPLEIPLSLVLGTRTHPAARRTPFEHAVARFLVAFPTCTRATVDAGHYPHLDRPRATAVAVSQLLARAEPALIPSL